MHDFHNNYNSLFWNSSKVERNLCLEVLSSLAFRCVNWIECEGFWDLHGPWSLAVSGLVLDQKEGQSCMHYFFVFMICSCFIFVWLEKFCRFTILSKIIQEALLIHIHVFAVLNAKAQKTNTFFYFMISVTLLRIHTVLVVGSLCLKVTGIVMIAPFQGMSTQRGNYVPLCNQETKLKFLNVAR